MGKYEASTIKKKNPLIVPVVILSILLLLLAITLAVIWNQMTQMRAQIAELKQSNQTFKTEEIQTSSQKLEVYVDEDLCVAAPYTTLHLPEQWSDCIRVEMVGSGVAHSLTFYGKVETKPEVALFAIHFNEDGALSIGTLQMEDSGEVYMSLTPAELKFDDTWTSDEIDLICAMQESTNYMTEALLADPAFVSG